MGKIGRGMLMVAADVAPEHEPEVNDWYDHEHLEERVAITGFLGARRYRAVSAKRKYLALYDTGNLAALESPEYRARLANQTDRSKRALKTFLGMHRAIVVITAGGGAGGGGAIGLARIAEPDGGRPRDAIAGSVLPALLERPGILAAHLLEGDARLSQPLPEAGPATTPLAAPGDWFLLVEGWDADVLKNAEDIWAATTLAGLEARRLGIWSLISSLSRSDL